MCAYVVDRNMVFSCAYCMDGNGLVVGAYGSVLSIEIGWPFASIFLTEIG